MNFRELTKVLSEDKARYIKQPFGKRTFYGYLFWLRLAHYLRIRQKDNLLFTPPLYVILLIYKLLSHIYQIQIPVSTSIGGGLKFAHYGGIVIAGSSVIGKNCTLHQNVTIGNGFSQGNSGHSSIGDNVVIFPGAVIAGNLKIGNHVLVLANSVVTKNVPDNSIVGGIPAKVIGNYDNQTLSDFAKELYEI